MDSLSSSLFTPFLHTKIPTLSPPTSFSPYKIPLILNVSSQVESQHSITPPPPPTTKATPLTQQRNTTTTTTKTTVKNNTTIASKTTTRRPPPDVSLPAALFNTFDDIINNFIDPPLRSSVDPKHVLADNFAPVDELPPTECMEVEGQLPPCLDGAYIRNGPNPHYLPRGPYHLFDGDGMLQSLRISQGRATFCSRYVHTYKFTLEQKAGSPVLPNVFSGFYGLGGIARGALCAARALTGQFNPLQGVGLANTSVVLFGDRLFALGESDLPYAVRLTEDGDIETVERCDFEGKLFMGMTAHPKIDPETGEMFAFRYGPVPPFLTMFRFDVTGRKQADVPIFSMMQPSLLHDFAITKNYAIFPDIQIGMNPMEMIAGGGSPVGSDLGKVPRIGVIPRYASNESKMRWFEVAGFNIMHAINAWEEEDTIVLVAPNILSIEHTLERMDLIHCSVEKVKIDLKSGNVTRTTLSARNLEFGAINPRYVGRRNRYAYMGVGEPMPKMSGVVKLDFEELEGDCTVAIRHYGPGCFGGEPFFVAKDPDNAEADEDDGYVVSYVHDENSGESRFIVMDAKSPTLEIVASVKLPRRVPYGFHGLFVRERDLTHQFY
ncbi:nine-cis-epoxycarotenoid dioxygenase 4 [Tasmannia lanceolata]|uniref:nine-cis-epoxycarotenoid dioxygenase 4 n=1 Tax=Tasmannia lanceolata TaxID=3420 RepID=UPI004063E898